MNAQAHRMVRAYQCCLTFKLNDTRRSEENKRTIEYRSENDKWDYIGGARRLPGTTRVLCVLRYLMYTLTLVQWSAWLTHTRQHPPQLKYVLRM